MKQLTRDLYTSGRVWLSISHNFTQDSADGSKSVDLVKENRGYVTLNAGALFVLTFWATGERVPAKFFIPEYKIQEFKSILETLLPLKYDPKYANDNELTSAGKASSLYYRLSLSNKDHIDVYFVEFEYNGEKSINVAIEYKNKVYQMYDSNVLEIIDNIPGPAEITRYKQDAAALYYLVQLGIGTGSGGSTDTKPVKKSEPRTITQVKRPRTAPVAEVTPPQIMPEPNYDDDIGNLEIQDTPPVVKKTEAAREQEESMISPSGFNYEDLLGDE